MGNDERIEKLIQKTLDQFERPETLPSNPFLYARIRQRLESRGEKRRVLFADMRVALLAFLVVLNIVVAYWHYADAARFTQTDTRQELIDILAGDLKVDSDQATLLLND